MKVLLTGATGLVGTALGQALVAKGHECLVLLRSENSIVNFPAKKFFDAESALREADALINLAGANIASARWSEKRKKELYDSRIETTKTLAAATKRKLKVVISASATGYYGDRGEEVLSENSASGLDFLSRLCVDWEKAAAEIPAERLVIPRLGVVLSLEGGFLKQVAPLFTVTGASPLGSGRQWFSWIHIDDLVQIFLKALENESINGVYNAVAPEFYNNAELTGALGAKLKVYPAPPVPALALKTLYGELSVALIGSQRVRSERLLEAGFRWRFQSLTSALDDFYPDLKTGEIRFIYSTWLPKTPPELWPFFSSETNLEKLTPPFLNFKVLKKSTPEVQAGTIIDYRLKLYGVGFKWRTRIEEWRKNQCFVDDQLKGPYAKWYHRHDFEPLAGGTLMRDTLTFKLPLGWLGRTVALRQVLKTVDSIFSYRTKIIDRTFSTR